MRCAAPVSWCCEQAMLPGSSWPADAHCSASCTPIVGCASLPELPSSHTRPEVLLGAFQSVLKRIGLACSCAVRL